MNGKFLRFLSVCGQVWTGINEHSKKPEHYGDTQSKAEEEITHFSPKISFLVDKFWVLTIADNSILSKLCTDRKWLEA